MRLACLSLAVALTATGCADDLRNDAIPDAGPGADASPSGAHITHTENADGTTTTIVDATSESAWIYLDLQSKEEKSPLDPATSKAWDLGFQRFQIKLNGGASGQGGMEVTAMTAADFDAITAAPSTAYVTDEADGDDEDEASGLAFLTGDTLWYDYDPTSHVLTPRELVYCLRSVEGDYYKLRILDYYANAGTSGYLEFQWGLIAAPTGAQGVTIDASQAGSFVYLSVAAGGTIAVADPAGSAEWDVADYIDGVVTLDWAYAGAARTTFQD